MKQILPKTIKAKIILITLFFTFVTALFMASICFYLFQSLLLKSQIQSTEFNLRMITESLNSDMEPILNLYNWCNSNQQISLYLDAATEQREYQTALEMEQHLSPFQKSSYKETVKKLNESRKITASIAWDRLQEEFRSNPSSMLINQIIIGNFYGDYIQMSRLTLSHVFKTHETITSLPYFDQLCHASGFQWVGLAHDPFKMTEDSQIIPIIRPINSQSGGEKAGWCYISVSREIFTAPLKNYNLPEDSSLYLTIGEQSYSLSGDVCTNISPAYTILEDLTKDTLHSSTSVLSVLGQDKKVHTMIVSASPLKGWYLTQSLSRKQFAEQKKLYFLLLFVICLIVLLFGIGLTFYLNMLINRPISKIRNKIQLISNGDFSRDPEIEWHNELGEVGKGINTLSLDVVNLMNRRIQDEKQKKELEYQMLQSQINPHFLYNTLNSIKWMATIQNAPGIAEMTTALSRLMKSVSKDTKQLCSLSEELDLLKDYFLIQQYRYGGAIKIQYDIQSEDLYQCRILKFSLQPLVENSIFHGIEPKGSAGSIVLKASHVRESQVEISITDDGIGISQDQIERILNGTAQNQSDFFQHIGINNVNQRIQYAFGPFYGLTIKSQPGLYTTMTLTIPFIPVGA